MRSASPRTHRRAARVRPQRPAHGRAPSSVATRRPSARTRRAPGARGGAAATSEASATADVARKADDVPEERGSDDRSGGRRADRDRRADERSQRPVESPLRGEFLRSGAVECPLLGTGVAAASQDRQRRRAASSAPLNANRSPSPVMGSMNPAASPASRRPGVLARALSTASGPRHTGGFNIRARSNLAPSSGSLRSDDSINACRIAERNAIARDHAGVRDPTRHRRDADIPAMADVHFTEQTVGVREDAGEVRAHRPSSRISGVRREAQALAPAARRHRQPQ